MAWPKIILCFLLLIPSCPILLVIKTSHSVQLQRESFSPLDGVLLMNHWTKPTRSSDLLSGVCFRLAWWLSCKESTCQCRRHGFDPWIGKTPWRREWLPTPVFPCGSAGKESACNAGDMGLIPGLGRRPGKGRGYPHQYYGLEDSGRNESDMTDWLSLSALGSHSLCMKLNSIGHLVSGNIHIYINICGLPW